MSFIDKKKVLDDLIVKHGMNIVVPGDSLPIVSTDDAFTFGKIKKVAECKIKCFTRRENYDYDHPDATVRYAYIALYYSIKNNKYYSVIKYRFISINEDTAAEWAKNTRFISGDVRAYDYERYAYDYESIGYKEVQEYLAEEYDKHVEKMMAHHLSRMSREDINKQKEARRRNKIINDVKEESGNYEKEDLNGFVL